MSLNGEKQTKLTVKTAVLAFSTLNSCSFSKWLLLFKVEEVRRRNVRIPVELTKQSTLDLPQLCDYS